MSARSALRVFLSTILLLVFAALLRNGILADKVAPAKKTKPATTESLGGAERRLTHVSTDKPIYRTGIRVMGLHRRSGNSTSAPTGRRG